MNDEERSLFIASSWQHDWILETVEAPQPEELLEQCELQPPATLAPPDLKESGSMPPVSGQDAASSLDPNPGERQDEAALEEKPEEGFAQSCCYEVVHRGGVFLREAQSTDSPSKGHLGFGQRVFGARSGAWLRVDSKDDAPATYALVDGRDFGLGPLLEEVPNVSEITARSASQPEDPQLPSQSPGPDPEELKEGERSSRPEPTEIKKTGPAQKARQAAVRRAATVAEEVLGNPVAYTVLAETSAYAEPSTQTSSLPNRILQVGSTVTGYPGSASWIRLAGGAEEWAPIKSSGKEIFLAPTWAQLQAEEVFSEALVVSWPGLAAPKLPYVAAYSVEWRLTPGEELPIGAGAGEDFKRSGYALSLQPRATVLTA